MKFNEFNLKEQIIKQIEVVGYKEPTPIQEKTIPFVLQGKDVLGLAKTGTGKTAAFVLPILQKLLEKPAKEKGVRALIVAPTRELAEQINNNIIQLSKLTNIKSATVYGGVSAKTQIEALKRGVEIVVGCPGRILDHINERHLKLGKLEFLVLDEADHMLDMGFLKDIEKIIAVTPKKKQTLLFSATMPSEIKKLTEDVLSKPVIVEIEYKDPVKLIEHSLHYVEHLDKKDTLFELLKKDEMESIIIFMNSKHKAKHLSKILDSKGHKSVNFQGNLSQNQRDAALDGFRKEKFKILVATDIAARGLDIPQVTHVINYDLPRTAEAFTHRSGRTGRANKAGKVISFATSEDKKVMGEIVKINKVNFSQVIGKEKPLDKETQKRKLMVKNENLGKKKQNVALKNEKISSEKTPQKRFYKAKAKTNNS
ncbi:MAG: DEAD/DEAH box helicase [Fusobacteriaceae bacterium]|nr:DEAD/DEAH box helicase [Fusobacteriaceae bacterium]MBP6322551.1 DEAD/DEAH box helicase [Fusobacteriaceae bacterium]MBP9510287.1 DEAD/DEAH box helicase [Fusobacteriaceae bacterium]